MANPLTDLPNHASARPTWSFHERYASDAEFKRQVDDGRRRATANRDRGALKTALDAVQGAPGQPRTKLY